jgi:nucleoside-diphosphate-sugar epimerase
LLFAKPNHGLTANLLPTPLRKKPVTHSSHSALIAGCGYLGLRAAKVWHNDSMTVTAITRTSDRAAEFQSLGLQPLQLDLSNPPEQMALPESDVVLWAVGLDRSTGVPRKQIWLDGLRWLIQNLSSAPRRFIYISSTSVYGQVNGEAVNEQTPTCPTTEGGECCVEAEALARSEFAARFPDTQVIVLRMAGIYGPDRLLRRVEDLRTQTPLPGEPDHCLNLIHVDDAVRLVNHAATADNVPEFINAVNSGTVTRHVYYSRLAELVAAPPPVFGNSENSTGRQRGGNKRVTSRYNLSSAARFQYDDVLAGLEDAVQRSTQSGQ